MSTSAPCAANETCSWSATIRVAVPSSRIVRIFVRLQRRAARGSSGPSHSSSHRCARDCGRPVATRYASSARVFFDGGSGTLAPSLATSSLPSSVIESATLPDLIREERHAQRVVMRTVVPEDGVVVLVDEKVARVGGDQPGRGVAPRQRHGG